MQLHHSKHEPVKSTQSMISTESFRLSAQKFSPPATDVTLLSPGTTLGGSSERGDRSATVPSRLIAQKDESPTIATILLTCDNRSFLRSGSPIMPATVPSL